MRVLIVSENAPVPGDRRVWNESRSLRDAGWDVVVACARSAERAEPAHEVLEGVEIHRYPLRPAGGAAGYAREYAQAVWRIRRLARRLARERPFDIVHACNPPDFLLAAARCLRRDGTALVFDHHDLVPELFCARYGACRPPVQRALLALERLAFALADVSLATNESYRRIAIERGRMAPGDVFVVRNGPDLSNFRAVPPDPALRRGRAHLISYVGMMGRQDGVDHGLEALAALRARRADFHAILVGDGEMLEPMRALAARLGLAGVVEFTGWQGDDTIRRVLCSSDVCLAPEPPSALNDVSTMIKIPEYLSMGRPVVAYDLPEARASAGPAAAYATPGEPASLARRLEELLDDPMLRDRMGRAGRERAERELAWQYSERALHAAYERALAVAGAPTIPIAPSSVPAPSSLPASALGAGQRP